MKKFYLYMIALLLASNIYAAVVMDIKFDSADKLQSVKKGKATIADVNGQKCLSIAKNISYVTLKESAVKDNTKYKLTIRAFIDRPDCIEDNNSALRLSRQNGRTFPSYKINLFDKAGKAQNIMLYGKIKIHYSAPIISRTAQDYVYVFYTTAKSEKMELEFKTSYNKLFVESVKLEQDKNDKYVNCTTDFSYGEINPNGWNRGVELFTRPDKKTVLKCGYYNGGPFFLVNDKVKYSFYCKGLETGTGGGAALVNFFDIKGNKTGYIHLFHGKSMKNGKSKSGLKPPQKTYQAQIYISNMIMSEIKVTKD